MKSNRRPPSARLAKAGTQWAHFNVDALRLDYYERELSFPPKKLVAAKKKRELVEKMLAEIDRLPVTEGRDSK